MWYMFAGAFIMLVGVFVGGALAERGQDRSGERWRQN